MMIEKTVSIVIPVYNVENYIKECLDSVINQTYSKLQIIVVDDGSTDLSGQICDEYASRDNRINVFHLSNSGQAAARNFGIIQAKGEYVVFIDSDDVVSPIYIAELYSLVNGMTNTIGVTKLTHHHEEMIVESTLEKKGEFFWGDERLRFILSGKYNYPVAKIYPRAVFDRISFPVGEIYEDMYIAPFIAEVVDCVVYKAIETYFYRTRSGSTMNTVLSERNLVMIKQLKDICRFFEEAYPHLKKDAAYFSFIQLRGLYLSSAPQKILDILWGEMVLYRKMFVSEEKIDFNVIKKLKKSWRVYSTYIGKNGTRAIFGTYLKIKKGR